MNYNYFPMGYPYTTQQTQNALTWVSGIEAAKAWYVAPNTTVALWDSEAQTIYLKSADVSGMPSMKILDYALRGAESHADGVSVPQTEYLTREDLEAVLGQISDLRDEIDNLSIRRTPKKKEIIEE